MWRRLFCETWDLGVFATIEFTKRKWEIVSVFLNISYALATSIFLSLSLSPSRHFYFLLFFRRFSVANFMAQRLPHVMQCNVRAMERFADQASRNLDAAACVCVELWMFNVIMTNELLHMYMNFYCCMIIASVRNIRTNTIVYFIVFIVRCTRYYYITTFNFYFKHKRDARACLNSPLSFLLVDNSSIEMLSAKPKERKRENVTIWKKQQFDFGHHMLVHHKIQLIQMSQCRSDAAELRQHTKIICCASFRIDQQFKINVNLWLRCQLNINSIAIHSTNVCKWHVTNIELCDV